MSAREVLGPVVDGCLVVGDGALAFADDVAALAGGQQGANLEFGADVVGGGRLLVGLGRLVVVALAAQGVAQAEIRPVPVAREAK